MEYLSQKEPRSKELFSARWQFHHGELSVAEAAVSPDFQQRDLPHDWSLEFPFCKDNPTCGSGGYVTAGIGWYRKAFRVSENARGRVISLLFDGAYMNSQVWLNGHFLGNHVYGYTPFAFDITSLLHYDRENLLLVRVDNSRQPNSRWYSGSGITRDVWLESLSPVHIARYGTYITTSVCDEAALVRVRSKITVPRALLGLKLPVLTAKVTLYGPQGEPVASGEALVPSAESGQLDICLTVDHPALWSDKSPALYRAEITVYVNALETDRETTVFGIRSLQFDAQKGFALNGVPTKLNGVCLHHDGGCVGAAVPRKVWRRRLKTLKEMGCNAIRCSHNPPDEALLELCDEMGFLVMDEAFDEWEILKQKQFGTNKDNSQGYSQWFGQCHKADIETMLLRDRNHPSIIIWSIGNEVPEQLSDDGWRLARELKGICNAIDPTRPITMACDQIEAEPRKARDSFLRELDIVGYNYVDRWRSRAETLYDTDKRANPERIILGSENTSAQGRRGDFSLEGPFHPWHLPYWSRPVAVGKLLAFTMTHDYVAGDFMWTGIDYLGESRWPERSASCGVLDTAGFPKDSYYLYRSAWTQAPMVYALPHWNLDLTPGTILPVLCYTNCDWAELWLNGKCYGRKSTNYPACGMSKTWGHYDKEPLPPSTNDMFLSWDVPYEPGELLVKGCKDGKFTEYRMITTGAPHQLALECDCGSLSADGRDISHITIRILDRQGREVPTAENRVTVTVTGAGKLLGLDSGDPRSQDSLKGPAANALAGKLLAIVQAAKEPGTLTLTAQSPDLGTAQLTLTVK